MTSTYLRANSILDLAPEFRAKTEARFWDEVEKTPTCWLWQGDKSFGYGRLHMAGTKHKKLSAHRASYELAKGRIPVGLTIDHLCRRKENRTGHSTTKSLGIKVVCDRCGRPGILVDIIYKNEALGTRSVYRRVAHERLREPPWKCSPLKGTEKETMAK